MNKIAFNLECKKAPYEECDWCPYDTCAVDMIDEDLARQIVEERDDQD